MNVIFGLITLFWAILFAYWVLKRRGALHSLKDMFILTASYYALCVPLDALFGLEIPSTQSLYHFDDVLNDVNAFWVLILYLLCLLSFFCSYYLVPRLFGRQRNHDFPSTSYRTLRLPPTSLLVIACSIFLFIYTSEAWELSRRQRNLFESFGTNLWYINVVSTALFSAILFYIWFLDDRRQAFFIMLFGILFSLVLGGRTFAVVSVLTFITRYTVTFSGFKLLCFAVFAFLFANFGKHISYQLRNMYVNDRSISVRELPTPSFSRLEGAGAFGVVAFVISSGESPLYFGETYIVTTFEDVVSRYFTGEAPERLAEKFMKDYLPEIRARGNNYSYPAMAEAWLNFGMLGPILIGLVLGALCKWVDDRPRGILFITLFFFIMRFFRSDFTSAFKLLIVFYGGSLAFLYFASLILQFLFQSKNKSAAIPCKAN